jgi:hypothetical protein
MQDPVGICRLDVLGVHRVAQLQLSREASLRPLRHKHVLSLLVFRATLCSDRQDVSLRGDVDTGRIHAGQVQRDMKPVVGLPHIHGHRHRGSGSRQ